MKRWILLTLVVLVVAASLFVLRLRLTASPSVPHAGLARTPNSAYKYDLCTQAYAYAFATPNNPYKTDYTFRDPFRKANDTIIPRLLGYDGRDHTVTFSVKIIINQVATFNELISHVSELDGISILLPDLQNHLQRSGVPQFIISSLGNGRIAVLDYTCPEQWVWKLMPNT